MCHWIRKVSQLMFKWCCVDFVYCDFDVDHLVFEIQISFYCHIFLSANVRHNPHFEAWKLDSGAKVTGRIKMAEGSVRS